MHIMQHVLARIRAWTPSTKTTLAMRLEHVGSFALLARPNPGFSFDTNRAYVGLLVTELIQYQRCPEGEFWVLRIPALVHSPCQGRHSCPHHEVRRLRVHQCI